MITVEDAEQFVGEAVSTIIHDVRNKLTMAIYAAEELEEFVATNLEAKNNLAHLMGALDALMISLNLSVNTFYKDDELEYSFENLVQFVEFFASKLLKNNQITLTSSGDVSSEDYIVHSKYIFGIGQILREISPCMKDLENPTINIAFSKPFVVVSAPVNFSNIKAKSLLEKLKITFDCSEDRISIKCL